MPVLDASAILALLQREPRADGVANALTAASITAVNFSEVWQKLLEHGLDPASLTAGLQALGLSVVPFDRQDAVRAAELRESTCAHGLSLADRACLALGSRLRQEVLTADRAWARIDVGVTIRQIR